MINTGSEGPDLLDFLEVPEIIQKVLQYVRKSKLANWEELVPAKKHHYIKKQRKQTHHLKWLPSFGHY